MGKKPVGLAHKIASPVYHLKIAAHIVINSVHFDQAPIGLHIVHVVVPCVALFYDAVSPLLRGVYHHFSIRIKFIGALRKKPVGLAHKIASAMYHLKVAAHIVVRSVHFDQTPIGLHIVHVVVPCVALFYDAVFPLTGRRHHQLSICVKVVLSGRQQTIGAGHIIVPISNQRIAAVDIIEIIV